MFNNINGIIFDLDGTLLDSMHIWQDVDRKYLNKHGIEFDPLFSEEIKKMTFKESAVYFQEKFKIKRTCEEIMNDWNEMVEIEYRDNILCKSGVKSILSLLKDKNIKMCVATSCNKKHAHMALKRLGIEDYFSFVLTCKDVGKNKESPDIYYECANKMKTEVNKTMVFEDLLMAIKVAHNAGFKTCAIYDILSSHEKEELIEYSDYYIHDFNELL